MAQTLAFDGCLGDLCLFTFIHVENFLLLDFHNFRKLKKDFLQENPACTKNDNRDKVLLTSSIGDLKEENKKYRETHHQTSYKGGDKTLQLFSTFQVLFLLTVKKRQNKIIGSGQFINEKNT